MRHPRLSRSARLQRVARLLGDGQEHSSWEVSRKARTVAPGTCVSELRANGAEIECRPDCSSGKRVFFYKMTKGPRDA